MYFKLLLLVLVVAMYFDEDDDFSLAGLTQEDTGRSYLDSSHDENNFDLLLDCARNLANSEANAMDDFENSVFEIGMDSQTQDVSEECKSKGAGNAKRMMTNTEANDSSSVEVCNNFLRHC